MVISQHRLSRVVHAARGKHGQEMRRVYRSTGRHDLTRVSRGVCRTRRSAGVKQTGMIADPRSIGLLHMSFGTRVPRENRTAAMYDAFSSGTYFRRTTGENPPKKNVCVY